MLAADNAGKLAGLDLETGLLGATEPDTETDGAAQDFLFACPLWAVLLDGAGHGAEEGRGGGGPHAAHEPIERRRGIPIGRELGEDGAVEGPQGTVEAGAQPPVPLGNG